jgi:DNA topoisomerase-1
VELYAGRYGPYVKHGDVNATVPDKDRLDELTLDEAVSLISARGGKSAPARKTSARKAASAPAPVPAAVAAVAKRAPRTSPALARAPAAKKPSTSRAKPPAIKAPRTTAKTAKRTGASKAARKR